MMNNDNVEFMRAMWSMHPFGSSMPQFLRLPPFIANPLVPGQCNVGRQRFGQICGILP